MITTQERCVKYSFGAHFFKNEKCKELRLKLFLNTSNVGIIIKYTTLAYADKIGKKKENYNNEKKLYLLKIDGRILLILRKK